MKNNNEQEEPICPHCGGDDIECLDDCTKHRCVNCGKEDNNDNNT